MCLIITLLSWNLIVSFSSSFDYLSADDRDRFVTIAMLRDIVCCMTSGRYIRMTFCRLNQCNARDVCRFFHPFIVFFTLTLADVCA